MFLILITYVKIEYITKTFLHFLGLGKNGLYGREIEVDLIRRRFFHEYL